MGTFHGTKEGRSRGGHKRAYRMKIRGLYTFLCRDCGQWLHKNDERFLKVFDQKTKKAKVEEDRLCEGCLQKRIRATEEDIV